jgi:hypothetical protein
MTAPNPPGSPEQPRSVVATVLLLLVGIVLLLPGLCALLFMGLGTAGTSGMGAALAVLWLTCFVISAGGIALIYLAIWR